MHLNPGSMNQQKVYHFIENRLNHLEDYKTKTIRNLSKTAFSLLDQKNIDNVLSFCERLLEKRQWAYGIIAYDFAYRVKKQYSTKTFEIFERWLFNYVTGWGDCDDFCTHAFGELLSQDNHLFERVKQWTNHKKFTVRRASAVILIYPIKYHRYGHIDPLIISNLLINDTHDLVQKGYGWMLKVLSKEEPKNVYDYLKKHHHDMPRTAFRYALEKYDVSIKKELMDL